MNRAQLDTYDSVLTNDLGAKKVLAGFNARGNVESNLSLVRNKAIHTPRLVADYQPIFPDLCNDRLSAAYA